jgi:hypothetical protein
MKKYARYINQLMFTAGALAISSAVLAIDTGNGSMVDKADSYDLQSFHKDESEATWKSDKKDKPVATYNEKSPATIPTTTNSEAPPDVVKTPNNPRQVYESGQGLKVRENYKLSNDLARNNIPTLFEALESLEKQLNSYCPGGWVKVKEWRKPETDRFYVYYEAICL